MSFLAPLFLLGALAVAAPILLHLRRRRAKSPQPFPSLMFLDNVPVRAVKRRRLRDVALLMARCGVLLLLALTFAQPMMPSLHSAGDEAEGEQVLVLLDRSFSMSHANRWQRAQEAMRETLANPMDRVAWVAFDSQAEVITPWLRAADVSPTLLESISPGPGTTDYTAAVRAARRLLNTADEQGKVRVVLITDLQSSGWNRGERTAFPAGIELDLIDVRADAEPVNLAVLDARLDRRQTGDRERVVVTSRIAQFGGPGAVDASTKVRIELRIDDREVESLERELAAGEQLAEVEFQPFTVDSQSEHRGVVRVQSVDGSVAMDDSFRFVMAPGAALSVLLVERTGRRAEEALYLRRALRTLNDPRVRVESVQTRELSADLLARTDAVFLLDSLTELAAPVLARLEERLRQGAGVLITLGPQSGRALAGGTGDRASLPEVLAPPFDPDADAGSRSVRRLASRLAEHPVFRAFQAATNNPFGSVAFFRVVGLLPEARDRPLAFLEDGSALLVERPVGRGAVHFFASTLDTSWNDLPLHSAFVPWLDGEVQTLAGYRPRPPSYEVSMVADLMLDPEAQDWNLSTPQGERRVLDLNQATNPAEEDSLGIPAVPDTPLRGAADARTPEGRPGQLLLQLDEVGFYEISSAERRETVLLANNVDPGESDLATLDGDEFAAALVSGAPQGVSGEASASQPEPDAPRGRLWWAVAVATVGVLCAEGVLASLRGSGSRQPAAGGSTLAKPGLGSSR